MKITDAQAMYRGYHQKLQEQKKNLVRQRDEMQKKYKVTGSAEFSEKAATLQLSIDDMQKALEENQKVLESLMQQYNNVWNAEVYRQQGDTAKEAAEDIGKLMTVARRIAHGDKVPASDEKRLMQYNFELYMAAKNAAAMRQKHKPKKYASLWDDDKENDGNKYDPEGKAGAAEVQGCLPEIPDGESTNE